MGKRDAGVVVAGRGDRALHVPSVGLRSRTVPKKPQISPKQPSRAMSCATCHRTKQVYAQKMIMKLT